MQTFATVPLTDLCRKCQESPTSQPRVVWGEASHGSPPGSRVLRRCSTSLCCLGELTVSMASWWQTHTHMQLLFSVLASKTHLESPKNGIWYPFIYIRVPGYRARNGSVEAGYNSHPILLLWASCLHCGCPCAHRGEVRELGQLGSSIDQSQLQPGGPCISLCTELAFSELYWFVELQNLKRARRVKDVTPEFVVLPCLLLMGKCA